MAVLLNVYGHIIAVVKEKSCIYFAFDRGKGRSRAAPQPIPAAALDKAMLCPGSGAIQRVRSTTRKTMEMLNPHCGVDRDPRGVVRLTICNAGSLNILSSAVTDGVREGLTSLAGDRDIRAVILAGQSEKSMIGGAD